MTGYTKFDPALRHRLTEAAAKGLKRARKQQRHSIRRLAQNAEISPSHLDRMERGFSAPSTTVAERLIAALNLDTTDPPLAAQLRAEAVPGVGKDKEPT